MTTWRRWWRQASSATPCGMAKALDAGSMPPRWLLGALAVFTTAAVVWTLGGSVRGRAAEGYRHGAVATDADVCSQIGVDLLKRGGSAVDAAVGAALCVGAVSSHSTGLGGGGFMVVRTAAGHAETIDYRETAPAAATEGMFAGFSECAPNGGLGDATKCPSRLGGLAVAVPGELRGLEMAHRRHGRLPWRDVLAPVIALCRSGFAVTGANARAMRLTKGLLARDPMLRATFLRADGEPHREGDVLRLPRLAHTLELVAERGADAVYKGAVAERIVALVRDNAFRAGVLTLEDLDGYRPVVREVSSTTFQGRTVYSAPPPASGAVLAMVLNILEGFGLSCEEGRSLRVDQLMVEAFKFGYGHRSKQSDPCCGDPQGGGGGSHCVNASHCAFTAAATDFMLSKATAGAMRAKITEGATSHDPQLYGNTFHIPGSHGTTHLSVVGPDGDAVSLTATINMYFGAKLMTEDGIILNNEMDDFSNPRYADGFGVPPSQLNFIRPHKRPQSSSVPVVVVGRDGRVELVAGAAGGSQITTTVAQVLLGVLSFCESVRDAVDRPRIHHQLVPDRVSAEAGYPSARRDALVRVGHEWRVEPFVGVCQAVARGAGAQAGLLFAASDGLRKAGAAASGF